MNKLTCLFLFCLLAFGGIANATLESGIDFTGYTTFSGDGPWTLGYQFSTNEDIDVNHLGAFDLNQDGFVVSHDVGLWDNTGVLLASTTVDSSDMLDGFFRYSSIASVALSAGETYYVGANGYGGSFDTYALTATNLTSASEINYLNSAYNNGASLVFPSSNGNGTGYYGANFLFSSAAVPEPSSPLLLGLSFLGAVCMRRRKRA